MDKFVGIPVCTCDWRDDCRKGAKCPSRLHHVTEEAPECFELNTFNEEVESLN
jgi:hypothetical protein